LDQTLIERCDLAGASVAGQHDLPACRLHGADDAKQLGLHSTLLVEELDVVDEQKIDVGESLAVGLALPRSDGGVEGLDQVVKGEVLDDQARVDGLGGMATAMSKWVLPRPGPL